MTATLASPDTAYGVVTDATSLCFQRRLPGPIERVWPYLADSDLRRQWLASGEITPTLGSTFELVWRNDALSAADDPRPEGFGAESRALCTLTAWAPPHTLAFSWPGVGEVHIELRSVNHGEVMLTLTHTGCREAGLRLMVAAGWHVHLDILVARTTGAEAPSLWRAWHQLKADYAQRWAAAQG